MVANGHSHNPYYIDALFTTKQTIDQYWRNAPDFNNAVRTYESTRNPGYTYQLDPDDGDSYYRSIVGKMTLTTTQVTGAAFASTSGDPASFVVPGNASPAFDGAPLYGSPESAAAGGFDQQTNLLTTAKVRILSKAWFNAADGSAVFQVHTADGADGWMRGSTLLPRDSAAPKVWEADEGLGVFSPNGDGTQDSWTLTLGLSEPASWTLRIRDGNGNVKAHTSGGGDTAAMTWAPSSGSVNDGTYRWEIEATDGWDNGPLEADGTVKVDTQAPALSLADADAEDVPVVRPQRRRLPRDRLVLGHGERAGHPRREGDRRRRRPRRHASRPSLSGGAGTLTWDGRTSDGFAADGRYTISVRAKDVAGNLSAAQTRTVDLYAALGFVEVVAHGVLPAGRRRHGEDDDVLDAPPVAGDGDLDGGQQEQRCRAHARRRPADGRRHARQGVGRPHRRRRVRAAGHVQLAGQRDRRDATLPCSGWPSWRTRSGGSSATRRRAAARR